MKTDNQIMRIPLKYWELFDTMEDCECWKLIKALFIRSSDNLSWLSLTYYNIILVDISNIENQVNKWKKYWKLWWRPKKDVGQEEKKGGVIKNKTQDKISKDKINKNKISKVKEAISFQEIFTQNLDEDFKNKLLSKFENNILNQEMLKFISYWTEKSPKWKKERREKEKVFDIKRRFTMWMSNSQKFNKTWWGFKQWKTIY